MGLNTACNTCRAALHQMHLALLGAASGAKKVTRAAILLHHPLFSFLLNSICGCSCKFASFWLQWGELEGCSGGSWDYDCIVHRDKPWGKEIGKKKRNAVTWIKNNAKEAHNSATALMVVPVEEWVEYFPLSWETDHTSVWKLLQYNTDLNVWLYRIMSMWVFFNCFFDVEPANVMCEVCFQAEQLGEYFNLCENNWVSHHTGALGAGI